MRLRPTTSVLVLFFASLAIAACGDAGQTPGEDAGATATADGSVQPFADAGPGADATQGALGVSVSPAAVTLAAGASATVRLTLDRGTVQGPLVVTVEGTTSDLTAPTLTVPGGETSGVLTVQSAAGATGGARALTVRASGGGQVATAPLSVTIGREAVDTSFGTGGARTLDRPITSVLDLGVQADGKVLFLGRHGNDVQNAYVIYRFDEGGGTDPSFGAAGILDVRRSATIDASTSMAVQPDGKIVCGISGGGALGLSRFSADGAPDASFGAAGTVRSTVAGCTSGTVSDITQAADGSFFVAAGVTCGTGGDAHGEGILLHYTPTGVLDGSFGSGGMVRFGGTPTRQTRAERVVLDGSALMVLGTESGSAVGSPRSIVTRLSSGGVVDATFGTSGTWTAGYGELVPTLTVQAQGYVLGTNGSLFTRLTRAGVVDATFGDAGRVPIVQSFSGGDWTDSKTMLIADPRGRLLLVQTNTPKKSVEVWAYSADGVRDKSFAAVGRLLVPQPNFPGVVRLRPAPDGRILALVAEGNAPTGAIVRFFP